MPDKRKPIKYELRCKRIARKYLDEHGCLYGIYWKNVAGKTLNVTRINYFKDKICTIFATPSVPWLSYVFEIRHKYNCPVGFRREIELLNKNIELWAVYPNYKRRVW